MNGYERDIFGERLICSEKVMESEDDKTVENEPIELKDAIPEMKKYSEKDKSEE
jgi:hypothetical protein